MDETDVNGAPASEVPAWLVQALPVDPHRAVAPYEQVRAGLLGLIHEQRLPVGARLPSSRALAAALGISAKTAARAYKELEQAGVVTARPRLGTVVAAGDDAGRARLAEGARDYAALARQQGYSADEAVELLRAAFDA